ncbi:MAG: hypothetical protein IPK50_09465 [Fibrobacterota bacterium]|nr:MAG: hypothetical protein IPK50_09465 [Fibrobacterota bacterium]
MEKFDHDEIRVWIEQGTSIHIKAISPFGDPVELTEVDARNLASYLNRMADELENSGDD